MGLVQLVLPYIVNVCNSSMLGNFYTSSFTPCSSSPTSDDACRATLYISTFKLRGTYTNSTCSISPVNWFVNFRYFCILCSFAS